MPFAPGGYGSVHGEHAEERARSLMKKLANGAPDSAQRDFDGVPEERVEAGGHARILVQIARGGPRLITGFAEAGRQLVKGLAFGKHGEDRCHTLLPGFWFFRGLQAVGDGVEICFVQGFEEGVRFFIFFQCDEKIFGDGGFAGGVVGGRPAAVFFRGVNFGLACGMHAAGMSQAFDVQRVDLGPATLAAPGGEFLQPGEFVVALLLAVDPAETEGFVEGLRITYRVFF